MADLDNCVGKYLETTTKYPYKDKGNYILLNNLFDIFNYTYDCNYRTALWNKHLNNHFNMNVSLTEWDDSNEQNHYYPKRWMNYRDFCKYMYNSPSGITPQPGADININIPLKLTTTSTTDSYDSGETIIMAALYSENFTNTDLNKNIKINLIEFHNKYSVRFIYYLYVYNNGDIEYDDTEPGQFDIKWKPEISDTPVCNTTRFYTKYYFYIDVDSTNSNIGGVDPSFQYGNNLFNNSDDNNSDSLSNIIVGSQFHIPILHPESNADPQYCTWSDKSFFRPKPNTPFTQSQLTSLKTTTNPTYASYSIDPTQKNLSLILSGKTYTALYTAPDGSIYNKPSSTPLSIIDPSTATHTINKIPIDLNYMISYSELPYKHIKLMKVTYNTTGIIFNPDNILEIPYDAIDPDNVKFFKTYTSTSTYSLILVFKKDLAPNLFFYGSNDIVGFNTVKITFPDWVDKNINMYISKYNSAISIASFANDINSINSINIVNYYNTNDIIKFNYFTPIGLSPDDGVYERDNKILHGTMTVSSGEITLKNINPDMKYEFSKPFYKNWKIRIIETGTGEILDYIILTATYNDAVPPSKTGTLTVTTTPTPAPTEPSLKNGINYFLISPQPTKAIIYPQKPKQPTYGHIGLYFDLTDQDKHYGYDITDGSTGVQPPDDIMSKRWYNPADFHISKPLVIMTKALVYNKSSVGDIPASGQPPELAFNPILFKKISITPPSIPPTYALPVIIPQIIIDPIKECNKESEKEKLKSKYPNKTICYIDDESSSNIDSSVDIIYLYIKNDEMSYIKNLTIGKNTHKFNIKFTELNISNKLLKDASLIALKITDIIILRFKIIKVECGWILEKIETIEIVENKNYYWVVNNTTNCRYKCFI